MASQQNPDQVGMEAREIAAMCTNTRQQWCKVLTSNESANNLSKQNTDVFAT